MYAKSHMFKCHKQNALNLRHRGAKTQNLPDNAQKKFLDEVRKTVSCEKPKKRVFASHYIAMHCQRMRI